MVGFPFFMLISAILAVGFMLVCTSSLDYATQKAARQIMVGTPQGQNLNASQFATTVLCPLLPSAIFVCSNVVVNLTTVTETPEPTAFYSFAKPDRSSLILPPLNNSKNSFCMGSGSSYEVLEVLYPLPLYLSVFASAPNVVQGKFVIMSTALFKNEPFQGSASSGAGC